MEVWWIVTQFICGGGVGDCDPVYLWWRCGGIVIQFTCGGGVKDSNPVYLSWRCGG